MQLPLRSGSCWSDLLVLRAQIDLSCVVLVISNSRIDRQVTNEVASSWPGGAKEWPARRRTPGQPPEVSSFILLGRPTTVWTCGPNANRPRVSLLGTADFIAVSRMPQAQTHLTSHTGAPAPPAGDWRHLVSSLGSRFEEMRLARISHRVEVHRGSD